MNKEFNKGLLLAGFGSFWWGFFGVLYFKYIAFIGHIELVIHRCLWTTFTLVITTFLFSKWSIFFKIVRSKKNLSKLVPHKDFNSFKENYFRLERIKISKELSSSELEKLIIEDIEEMLSVINDKMNILFRGRYGYKRWNYYGWY